MPNPKNKAMVSELTEKFKAAQSVVIADYRGLNSEETEALRTKVRAAGVELRVRKNRLIKLAIRAAGQESPDAILKGPSIVAFGTTDPSTPAKVLLEFAKTNEKLVVKGGLFEGKAISLASVQELASLPTREEMLSRMLSSLMSPVQNLAYAVEAARTKIVHAVDAVRRQKEEQGGAA